MPKVGSFNTNDLEEKKQKLFKHFEENIIHRSSIPSALKEQKIGRAHV